MLKYFFDMILLPEEVFTKLSSVNRKFLYMGMVLVGLFNFISAVSVETFIGFFAGMEWDIAFRHMLIACVVSVVLGAVDVFVFCYPLDSALKWIPRPGGESGAEDGSKNGDTFVKLQKVYVYSHIPIMIVSLILEIIYYGKSAPDNIYYLILSMLIVLWFTLIITKGCNIIYNAAAMQRVIHFLLVFFWISLTPYLIVWIGQQSTAFFR